LLPRSEVELKTNPGSINGDLPRRVHIDDADSPQPSLEQRIVFNPSEYDFIMVLSEGCENEIVDIAFENALRDFVPGLAY